MGTKSSSLKVKCSFTGCTDSKGHDNLHHPCEISGCGAVGHSKHEHGSPSRIARIHARNMIQFSAVQNVMKQQGRPYSASVCRVPGCAFPSTHITRYHWCGICRKVLGDTVDYCPHISLGVLTPTAFLELEASQNDFIPRNRECAVEMCSSGNSHTT